MLIEIGIGDAYGAGFEFAKPERLLELTNDLKQYYRHNLPGFLPPGSYTDDTQMSIAIAEHILSGKPWEVEILADKFVEVFKRDPRNGYSRALQGILENPELKTGDDLRRTIIPNSDKCGAAMRSVPIGLLSDRGLVKTYAHLQASITHNTTNGILSAQAVALAAHFYHYAHDDYGWNLETFLNLNLSHAVPWHKWEQKRRATSDSLEVVQAALSAVARHGTLADILIECIDYTGDVDSIAAIAMGVASLNPKIIKNLPLNLEGEFENGVFGRDFLNRLDADLLTKFPRRM